MTSALGHSQQFGCVPACLPAWGRAGCGCSIDTALCLFAQCSRRLFAVGSPRVARGSVHDIPPSRTRHACRTPDHRQAGRLQIQAQCIDTAMCISSYTATCSCSRQQVPSSGNYYPLPPRASCRERSSSPDQRQATTMGRTENVSRKRMDMPMLPAAWVWGGPLAPSLSGPARLGLRCDDWWSACTAPKSSWLRTVTLWRIML